MDLNTKLRKILTGENLTQILSGIIGIEP